jgi:hypothetical protein
MATQKLLADSRWCRALEKMDADADKTTRAAKMLLADPNFAVVPDQISSEMIRCGMIYNAADSAFRKVCIAVTNGKCGSKEFTASFMKFSTLLQALQEIVSTCDGIVKARPLITVEEALVTAKFVAVSKLKQMSALRDKLRDLIDALKKANTTASKAEWARFLNAALSTATLTLAPEARLMKFAASLSGGLGHFAIDKFLGPKGVTVPSASRTVIGDGPDVIEGCLNELGKHLETVEALLEKAEKSIAVTTKGLGVGAAIATFGSDSGEVDEAKKAIAEAKEALEVAQRNVDFAEKTVSPLVRQLPQLDRSLRETTKALQRALAPSNDAAMKYAAAIALVKKL